MFPPFLDGAFLDAAFLPNPLFGPVSFAKVCCSASAVQKPQQVVCFLRCLGVSFTHYCIIGGKRIVADVLGCVRTYQSLWVFFRVMNQIFFSDDIYLMVDKDMDTLDRARKPHRESPHLIDACGL